jgi:hypothetical protein
VDPRDVALDATLPICCRAVGECGSDLIAHARHERRTDVVQLGAEPAVRFEAVA